MSLSVCLRSPKYLRLAKGENGLVHHLEFIFLWIGGAMHNLSLLSLSFEVIFFCEAHVTSSSAAAEEAD